MDGKSRLNHKIFSTDSRDLYFGCRGIPNKERSHVARTSFSLSLSAQCFFIENFFGDLDSSTTRRHGDVEFPQLQRFGLISIPSVTNTCQAKPFFQEFKTYIQGGVMSTYLSIWYRASSQAL
jgi:hypothetical protein